MSQKQVKTDKPMENAPLDSLKKEFEDLKQEEVETQIQDPCQFGHTLCAAQAAAGEPCPFNHSTFRG